MSLEERLAAAREDHLAELFDFLRIPSVSTDPRHTDDVRRAADFLQRRLVGLGFETELVETPRHPALIAERRVSDELPTVLVYGHYDVQPPDPEHLWESPPFEPTIRDGAIVARGASDDKGQVYAHVLGAESLLQQEGELPVNLVFLIEGEEEIGSPNLGAVLEAHTDRLTADVVLISDGQMIGPDTPTLTYGLRGLSYLEVRVRGPKRDLHSGAYGGAAPNPLNALAQIIAGLHDENGRVTVPGFYDRVRDLTEDERATLASLPFDEEAFREEAGLRATPGEAGYSVLERIWARPTLDVNGMWGGFQGEGAKTVISSDGGAKISCRLVPNQDHEEISRLVGEHLEALAPAGVEVEVVHLHGGAPAITPLDAPSVVATSRALERVFGRETAFVRTGGSIPVVSLFQERLGANVVLADFGLATDRVHSPNEKFDLENYYRAIHSSAEILRELGTLRRA